jgi:hypothetical protein
MMRKHIKIFFVAILIGAAVVMVGTPAFAQVPTLVLTGTVTTPDGAPINGIRFRGGVWSLLNGVTRECVDYTSIAGRTNNTYAIRVHFHDRSECLVQMNRATVNAEGLAANITTSGYVFRPR